MEMHEKIDHVVVLMLENRSLDNVLGWLYSSDEADDQPKRFVGADTTPRYNGLQGVHGITKGTVGASHVTETRALRCIYSHRERCPLYRTPQRSPYPSSPNLSSGSLAHRPYA
jgi:phospholipase C